MNPRGTSLFQFDRLKANSLKKTLQKSQIVGIDESGRGPWAGPVVACAVWLPEDYFHADLDDSKRVAPIKRVQIYENLMEKAFWGLGIVEVHLIDSLNIWNATRLAMKKALEEIQNKHPQLLPNLVLVDGLPLPPLGNIKQESIVKGDSLSASIAAASIIAKVKRDQMMEQWDKEYPYYGFAKHKGYGTKLHQKKLDELGPSPIHRKSFSPVLTALKKHGL